MKLTKLEDVFTPEYYQSLKVPTSSDSKAIWDRYLGQMKLDVRELLATLDHKSLTKIDDKGHNIRFIRWYNDFVVRGQKTKFLSSLEMTFYHFVSYNSTKLFFKDFQPDLFSSFNMVRSDSITCENDETENHLLKYDLKENKFYLMEYSFSGKLDTDIIPAPLCSISSLLYKRTITFPTGKLIMADALRSDYFNKITKKPVSTLSINSVRGKVENTDYALENFNYMRVNLTNTCGSLISVKNRLIFGDEKGIPYHESKYPTQSCDAWSLILIEEEVLIKILQKAGLNLKEAKKEIIELLSERRDSYASRVTIEPGTYDFYFDAHDCENFNRSFKAAGHKLAKKYDALMLLERRTK